MKYSVLTHKIIIMIFSVALCAMMSTSSASATVIDFEDFPTPGAVYSLQGLIGNYYQSEYVVFSTDWYAYNADGLYPAHSGTVSAIGSPFPAEIQFLLPASNVGAYFNVYISPLTVSAYSNALFLGSIEVPSTVQPTPGGPIFYSLPFNNITKITLTGNNSMFYNMDDLTFSVSAPEPSTIVLLLGGLLGSVAFRMKFRK